ncbi:peptidoglycan-recognition protein LC isoform X1 [Drosophila miranda]|uniref:peptidoglycan-recognition protein LC isoform X1 n=1 Tax=Drosophila miranda TaxID=7229 RepID=UPI0007E7F884|nr:peptidoglycan-recognition protein LC isoform X1 [Drosophila miranda]XP_017136660.1 peptidoglycan-recognition protein LC isoform X1 [Drosophila miranda]XP_017136661.1 peptidoglycan-recognition protein LC isoform X1 [Drosophila miranda]XP_017136662.1 peptidoglycan-recognition protein LC isoform X1 [Drosophila miranda]XP_017136663.1 peptidoglycan-recognition protein LC isoform X1 [Drosophila miranda]
MHVNYERNMNGQPLSADMSNRIINLTTGKNCSTSSTDSGVILIDNVPTLKVEGPMTKDTSSSSDEEPQSKPKAEANMKSQDPKLISIEHTVNISQSKGAKTSPTLSIRSTTISIVSIDENALDSSCIDSDSDVDGIHDDCTVQKLGQQISYPPNCSSQLRDLNQGLTLISRQVTPGQTEVSPPTASEAGAMAKQLLNGSLALATPTQTGPNSPQGIGSIALTNSTDVTFGDKHFYEGPVTIQQFLIDNRDKWKPGDCADGGVGAGQDNPAFNGRPQANGTAAGSKLDDPGQQAPMLCPYLPNTISRKAISITVAFVLLTTLLGIILATTTNLFGKTLNKSKLGDVLDDSRLNIPINSTIDQDNIGGGLILRFVHRQAWLAQPPQKTLADLTLPVSLVIVLPTNSDNCSTQAQCVLRVRLRQTFDIESLQEDDIAFNFVIGGDGNVYVGRGWNQVGAHMSGYNVRSLSFAYIGSFQNQKPSAKQLSVTHLLLERGVSLGKISPNYRLTGASKLEPSITEYKADQLYQSFSNWTHWS